MKNEMKIEKIMMPVVFKAVNGAFKVLSNDSNTSVAFVEEGELCWKNGSIAGSIDYQDINGNELFDGLENGFYDISLRAGNVFKIKMVEDEKIPESWPDLKKTAISMLDEQRKFYSVAKIDTGIMSTLTYEGNIYIDDRHAKMISSFGTCSAYRNFQGIVLSKLNQFKDETQMYEKLAISCVSYDEKMAEIEGYKMDQR